MAALDKSSDTVVQQWEEIRTGYGYETFHLVQPAINAESAVRKLAFRLDFAVEGKQDAHILLSPTVIREPGQQAYEIVIGAGNNTYTAVRSGQLEYEDQVEQDTPGILSPDEFRNFYILMYEDGLIEVGKQGEQPLISYTDKTPLQVKYFSFGAYHDVTVKFVFETIEKKPESEPDVPERVEICTGYDYDTFHPVHPPSDVESADRKLAFQLDFGAEGERDAHILLSPKLIPYVGEPVYEIVLGAGDNTFTAVRRGMLAPEGHRQVASPGILSATELRHFYINLYKNGLLEVGRKGEEPLISFSDDTPLQIKYFSFSAYYGATVKFVYRYKEDI